jgi:hypothetical protein
MIILLLKQRIALLKVIICTLLITIWGNCGNVLKKPARKPHPITGQLIFLISPKDAPDDAINRIKSATTLGQQSPKPLPHAINEQSPEYMFGEAFTNLVRHIVIDYLDKSVEPIIREAITSEIKQISKNNSSKKN